MGMTPERIKEAKQEACYHEELTRIKDEEGEEWVGWIDYYVCQHCGAIFSVMPSSAVVEVRV
jgi:rubrerythrin